MVSDFQWKLIIAGSVGGFCALVSSILVFAILACRHQRKLEKRAVEQLNRKNLSAQWSAQLAEPSDLVRGLDRVVTSSADLPLPLPPDGNYIRTTWGVGNFWMGQNSLNHDSGCGDLESNRTDSALFIQRSFSPLPRNVNAPVVRTLPGDVFPAMSHFNVDTTFSHSFDLLSPYPGVNLNHDAIHDTAKLSNPQVMVPPLIPAEEDIWKSRISCHSDNNIRSLCQESRGPSYGLQLVELAHTGNRSRSQYTGFHASVPSSSDNDDSDPIWIRQTNVNPDGAATRSAMDCNRSDVSSSWNTSNHHSVLNARTPVTRDYGLSHPVATPCGGGRAVSENISAFGYNRCSPKKRNGYSNPWETRGIIDHAVYDGGTN